MNEFSFVQMVIYFFSVVFSLGALLFLYIGIGYRKRAVADTNLTTYQIMKVIHSVPTKINDVVNKSKDLLTRKLIPDGELTHGASEIGIGNIEFLLSNIIDIQNEKPYLFGVNKGGAFLANYLSHRIDLHEKYLVKCDYRVDLNKIYCENRDISGPIVVIDDVVRTGRTLNEVKSHLRRTYPKSPIYCVALVVASNKDDRNEIFKVVDYAAWFTGNKNITLPWSREPKKIIDTDKYFNDKEMDQIVGRINYLKNLTISSSGTGNS